MKRSKKAQKHSRKIPGAKRTIGTRWRGKFTPEQTRRKLMHNATKAEKIMKQYLKLLEIKYLFQYIIKYEEGFYIADFYLPDHNLVVEVDGEHHVTNKEQIKRDLKRTKTIRAQDYKLRRITNKQVYNWSLNKIQSFIEKE